MGGMPHFESCELRRVISQLFVNVVRTRTKEASSLGCLLQRLFAFALHLGSDKKSRLPQQHSGSDYDAGVYFTPTYPNNNK